MRRRANWKSTFSRRATPMPESSAPATDEERNERTDQAWEPIRQTASGCPTLRILRPHVPAGARRHTCEPVPSEERRTTTCRAVSDAELEHRRRNERGTPT